MDTGIVAIIAQKELRDARSNRWLMLYALAFAVLALALAWMALSGAGAYGTVGFGRTAASLVNLVILIVPLMGLTMGALAISSEREKGTLVYLMAQPISKFELLSGKFIGMSLALMAALVLGFGISGMFIALRGGTQVTAYLSLIGLSFVLVLVSLSIGFLVSVTSKKGASAVGLALFVWLLLAFFTDLGLMGTALALKLEVRELFLLSVLNPLQVFKMEAILILRSSLDVLGPGGVYAMRTFGDLLMPALLGVLFAAVAISLGLAYIIFDRKGDLS